MAHLTSKSDSTISHRSVMTRTANVNHSRAAVTWTISRVIQICRVTRAPAMDLQAASNRSAQSLRTDIPTGRHPTSEVLQAVAMTATLETDRPSVIWICQLKLASATARLSPVPTPGAPAYHRRSASVTTQVKSGHRSSPKSQLGATTTTVTTDSPATTENQSFHPRSSSTLHRCATISS